MSISTLGTLFQFIGGLGMFLYGMESMADGLQKFAGNRLQRVLEILTSNRLLGVLVGYLQSGARRAGRRGRYRDHPE